MSNKNEQIAILSREFVKNIYKLNPESEHMCIPLVDLQRQMIALLNSDIKNQYRDLEDDAAKNIIQYKINTLKSFSENFNKYLDNLAKEN